MNSLLDGIITQALFFERYKIGFEQKAEALAILLTSVAADVMRKEGITDFNDLGKMRFARLRSTLAQELTRTINAFFEQIDDELLRFISAETLLSDTLLDDYLTREQTTSLYGAKLFQDRDSEAIYAAILSSIIGATGLDYKETISATKNNVVLSIVKKLNTAKADGVSPGDFVSGLTIRDADTERAPIAQVIAAQMSSLLATILQHVQASLFAGLASLYVSSYEWISVLDGQTTNICRSRDGNIYVFGAGPQPPAHYRCRSRTLPLARNQAPYGDVTLPAWVSYQPQELLEDIFGKSVAKQITDNKIDVSNIRGLLKTRPLTLTNYEKAVIKHAA